MNDTTDSRENAALPDWPVLRAWLSGENPTGLAADLMEVEVASIIREVESLRVALAAAGCGICDPTKRKAKVDHDLLHGYVHPTSVTQ